MKILINLLLVINLIFSFNIYSNGDEKNQQSSALEEFSYDSEDEEAVEEGPSWFDTSNCGRCLKCFVGMLAIMGAAQQMIPQVAAAPTGALSMQPESRCCVGQTDCKPLGGYNPGYPTGVGMTLSTAHSLRECVEDLGVHWQPELVQSELCGRPSADRRLHSAVVICQQAVFDGQAAEECMREAKPSFTGLRGGEHLEKSVQVCRRAGFSGERIRSCKTKLREPLGRLKLGSEGRRDDLALELCSKADFEAEGLESCLAKVPKAVSYGERLFHAESCADPTYEPHEWEMPSGRDFKDMSLEEKVRTLRRRMAPPQ